MSGVRNTTVAIWLAAALAFVNFAFTFVGVWLVEKMGRRLLSLLSIAGMWKTQSSAFYSILVTHGKVHNNHSVHFRCGCIIVVFSGWFLRVSSAFSSR